MDHPDSNSRRRAHSCISRFILRSPLPSVPERRLLLVCKILQVTFKLLALISLSILLVPSSILKYQITPGSSSANPYFNVTDNVHEDSFQHNHGQER